MFQHYFFNTAQKKAIQEGRITRHLKQSALEGTRKKAKEND
jgi:hypothetical protein